MHGASYVGACIVRSHGGRWSVRRPLWESLVYLESHLGQGELPVFHWWLKSLADDATTTLADRYRTHVEVPARDARRSCPSSSPSERKLPRLKRPRYDAFYKYLRAHLPELRDVGEDFPSPERFEELRFEQLSFLLVGGGRMVRRLGPQRARPARVLAGKGGLREVRVLALRQVPGAAHARLRASDKLEVLLSQNGEVRSFELLWWGP